MRPILQNKGSSQRSSKFLSVRPSQICTEQMDAEGLGRKLLLTPSGDPEKQTVGTVSASHKMPTLQALSSSPNAGTTKGAAWAAERLLAALRQSVPQNGRVHLHIIDQRPQNLSEPLIGNAKCARTFFAQTFLNTARGPGHPDTCIHVTQSHP